MSARGCYCLSRAEEGVPPEQHAALRATLIAEKPSALRARAAAAGASAEQLDEADDADDRREFLIGIILRLLEAEGDPRATLRAELAGMKISALRRRAAESGADEDALDAADEADDTRAALTELVVNCQGTLEVDRLGALRAELGGLKMSALRARATAVDATREQLDDADDADDTKAALIELALSLTKPFRESAADLHEQLRVELAGMKISALRRRAAEAGADEDALDAADEANDKRAALTELIVAGSAGLAGRVGAAVIDSAVDAYEPEPEEGECIDAAPTAADDSGGVAALRLELQGMKVMALHKRALSMGISAELVDAAMDDDDAKAAVVGLIVAEDSRRGPVDRILSCLKAGGEACVELVSSVLDHAMDLLDQVSASSPRKARRSLRDVSDRVECVMETIDVEWCDGVCRCGEDEMGRLSSLLASLRGLPSSSDASEVCDVATAVLDCLDRCGSVVVQSMAVLSDAGAGGADPVGLLSALECLRGLSEERLDAVSSDEAAAYEVVQRQVSGMDVCVGAEVVSGCMALYTLGCRNGLALCGTVEVVQFTADIYIRWIKSVSAGSDDYAAGAASCALWNSNLAVVSKIPSSSRGPVESVLASGMKDVLRTVGKELTEQRVGDVCTNSMKASSSILSDDDLSLACGWCPTVFWLGYMYPGANVDEAPKGQPHGLFSAALALYDRVEPSLRPSEWWISTCDVVDAFSIRLTNLWTMFSHAKRLSSSKQSSWWSRLLDRAIVMVKLNASAGLCGRDTANLVTVLYPLGTVEMAAKDESQHQMLIEAGVMDALEYAILHDVQFCGNSVSSYASGAAVALVGRNEGGKVLRPEAVHAVLDRLDVYFRPESLFFESPPKAVMVNFSRVTIMAISDANKKHMLQFEPLIDMLLKCLIIDDDNHRKGQDGADVLQEASAGVLHELSLYGPGAVALRSHPHAVSTLHKLCEVGTKASKERGAAALFELEEDKRPKVVVAADDDGDDGAGTSLSSHQQHKPPPHVMASYNWDHQDVILRVVASLQDRGYLVWVDTEQMKGATVDTMALAVEGSEVVMIGVSRAYKESSNCRMEAQYALQKKKPLIPLMLTQGYEADGWLGLMLGTSMWYAFYGETLSSESAFESRIEALCREIGSRGRADGVSAASEPEPEPEPEAAGHSPLVSELKGLKLMTLHKRALSLGIDADAVEASMDKVDAKAAVIALIVSHADADADPELVRFRLQFEKLRARDLVARAQAAGLGDEALDAMDARDPKAALVNLLLRTTR